MALTADIQQQVFDLLSRASNLSFIAADRDAGVASQFVPGQRVSAEVVSMMPENRVRVRIGTENFNLDLPTAVRVGQTLEMTFVSDTPRSTFAMVRQAADAPPVSLSDASRLLGLLVSSEQIFDPQLRSSLQSIGEMIRSSYGRSDVMANLLDEALTYGSGGELASRPAESTGRPAENMTTASRLNADQARLATFESNAAQLLRHLATSSRSTLIEAFGIPETPLPLMPGEEVNATVLDTLPDGRSFVRIAGTTVELSLPQKVVPGGIVRLTFLASEPKPVFAISRNQFNGAAAELSETGRWMSVLEHSEGGVSNQQAFVLERLGTILKSIPVASPAFGVIMDEALVYRRPSLQQSAADIASPAPVSGTVRPAVLTGNGIVLKDEMARLLQAVITGKRLAILESQGHSAPPGTFAAGQQLKGEVLAALGSGRFNVLVAGQVLEFIMPKGIRRGDRVNLFFVSDEPRQTFLMVRFGRSGDSKVSDASRWLSGFMGEASSRFSTTSASGLLQTLLSGPTADAPLLGRMLQQALRDSGLFYESHLHRWFGGDYLLENLLREPQGKLSPCLMPPVKQAVAASDELIMTSVRAGLAEVIEAVFNKNSAGMAHEGMADQRSLPVVGEQLSALQSGLLSLRGDLFPGRHLEWTVKERDEGRSRSGARERSWETSVKVTMPKLGPVKVQVALDGGGVSVIASAGNSKTVSVLEEGKSRLIEQLEVAGFLSADVSVSHVAA